MLGLNDKKKALGINESVLMKHTDVYACIQGKV